MQEGILTSRIKKRVKFGAPEDVRKSGGGAVYGSIVDEVWADKSVNSKESHPSKCPNGRHCWGEYSCCSQLIEWDDPGPDGKYSIRLTYYRRRCGDRRWRFAGQTTLTAPPSLIRKLLKDTLAKKTWFEHPPNPESKS